MKTTTVSKRFIALLCCVAVCVALLATALGVNLASRAQAEDAQEDGIELLEEEPSGDIQLIEEETQADPEDFTGGEASQVGESAVTEESQTPVEEPASGEPDETPVPEDSTEPESPAVPEDSTEPENPAEPEGLPEESGEPEDAEPDGSEESAEPDLTGTEETPATEEPAIDSVDAAEAEPEDIDADVVENESDDIDADTENADAEDADDEEEATSEEDDYSIMLLAEVASGSFGADGDNLTWKLDDEGLLTISGTGAMDDWNKAADTPWYKNRTSITSVIIDEDVTNIGAYAFYNCTNLANIEILGSISSIGDYTFYGCKALTSVTMQQGVTSIGERAFYNCTSLTSVDLPSTLISIGAHAFYGCSALPSITIPESVTSIGDYAFRNCTKLANIEILGSISSIGDYTFYGCSALISISIPEGVNRIGDHAFYNCTSLKSVELPSSLTSIDTQAFCGCKALTSVTMLEGVTSISIGAYAFDGCNALPDITIPESVTSIGDYAFRNCTRLESVELPSTLTSIGNSAFYGCIALTDIEIPDNVTSIGSSAFNGCSALTSITIPEGITTIENQTFNACKSLVSAELPSSLISIGDRAFYYCISLSELSLPESLETIGSQAFQDCPLNGDSMTATTTVNAGAEVYSIEDGVTTQTTKTTTYIGHTLTLPESVTSVGAYAFENTYVDYFVIGSNLTSITGSAFASNSLEAIIFDNSQDQVHVDSYDDIVANAAGNAVSLIYGDTCFELSLTKDVVGYSGPDIFEFEITLTQQDGTPFSGEPEASLSDGTEYMVDFIDGKATVKIGSDETLTFWLPEDMEWSIVELTAAEGTVISVNDSEAAEAEGILTEDTAVTFTNYYKTAITVSIVWDDADDADGFRPDSVFVQLVVEEDPYSDPVPYSEPVELNADNGWSTAWSDLDTYADGHEIEYRVGVDTPDGYEVSGEWTDNGDGTRSLVVTYTYTGVKFAATIIKEWDNADDQDGIRPDSITVRLWADNDYEAASATITPDAEGIWSYTFEDLDAYRDGHEIIYSVTEDSIWGYVIEESLIMFSSDTASDYEFMASDAATSVIIVNSHTPETINISVIKEWDDADDADGIRPDSVTVHLWADNTYEVASATITPDDEGTWSYTFEGLPKYRDGGIEIVYNVTEDDVWGYVNDPLWMLSTGTTLGDEVMTIDSSTDKSMTIVNSHTPETTDISVTTVWEDADDQDGLQPTSITVQLLADGDLIDEQILSADNGWSYTWSDIVAKKYGDPITYSIAEVTVEGYTTEITGDAESGFVITNTHTPEQFNATVIKEWDDADDADGIRPDSVTVHLWADNTYEVASATITPDDEGIWSYTFEGLPRYRDGGIEIVYSVTEDDVWGYVNNPLWLLSEGSTSSFELMAADSSTDKSVTITNTHIPEAETPAPTMSDDVGAGTEVAPGESLTYTIRFTNGGQDGAAITITDVLDEGLDFVSATDGGVYDEATRTITWIISDVAAGAEGSVSFTVVVNENALTVGQISNSATIQINDEPAVATNIVTNPVKTASTITFEVVKVWNDNNDLYGARPDRIVVVLLENGKATDLTQLLSAENSWTGKFSDLPEYDANGQKIVYSIAEVTVPNYTSVITGDQDSGFTVTNTYDFAEITNPDSGNPNTGTPNGGTPNTGNPQPGNPDDGVPQTGQDSLPIAPLAISGVVIVAAGVALLAVRRRRAA